MPPSLPFQLNYAVLLPDIIKFVLPSLSKLQKEVSGMINDANLPCI